MKWLAERDVLRPGISTLTRLIAHVREQAIARLWDALNEVPTPEQRQVLMMVPEIRPGMRMSDLERWRTRPARASGPEMVKTLKLVREICQAGFGKIELGTQMPRRRLAEPARYGIGAKPSQLKRHPEARKLATLRHLEAKTVDDGLELLDLLMVTELLGKAQRAADKGTVRRAPKLAKASARLVVAVEVLLEATGWGEEIRLAEVWDAIDMVIPRAELRAAVATVTGIVPPPDAEDDGGWRAEMTGRIATVSGFVKLLPTIIAFGANAEGIEVLRAMRCLAAQLDSSRKWTTKTMHAQVVTGPWKRLVFGHPADPGGAVDKNAYTFCVLEQFHRHLKRREIYAETSLRWRNLNAHLLEGAEWAAVKTPVLTAPGPARGPRRAAGHSLGWPGCGLSRGRPEVLPVQAP